MHKGEKNLSIKVDDGQVIQVNKNVLTGASGVFEAMLAGQFLESNQKEVGIFWIAICTVSMTTLLTHTVAHSTKRSFRPETNNQPLKKFLSLALS